MNSDKYILMLESDPADRETTLSACTELYPDIRIQFLNYSNEVILYLTEKFIEGKQLPSLLIMRMNSLPENALLILKEIRSRGALRFLPVVILGENTMPHMIKACYESGVNTFISKPGGNEMTSFKIKTFLQYWFDVADMPEYDKRSSLMMH